MATGLCLTATALAACSTKIACCALNHLLTGREAVNPTRRGRSVPFEPAASTPDLLRSPRSSKRNSRLRGSRESSSETCNRTGDCQSMDTG